MTMTVRLARAVRAADERFQRTGGSSRHWVIECLVPALAAEGLVVVDAPRDTTEKEQAMSVSPNPADFLRLVQARLPENATLEFITWTRQHPDDTAYTWSTGNFKIAWEAWQAGQASGRCDVEQVTPA